MKMPMSKAGPVKKLLLAFILAAVLVPAFLYHLDSHVIGERKRLAARYDELAGEAKRVAGMPRDDGSAAEMERLEGEITALATAYNALPALLLRNGDSLPLSLPDVRTRRAARPLP